MNEGFLFTLKYVEDGEPISGLRPPKPTNEKPTFAKATVGGAEREGFVEAIDL